MLISHTHPPQHPTSRSFEKMSKPWNDTKQQKECVCGGNFSITHSCWLVNQEFILQLCLISSLCRYLWILNEFVSYPPMFASNSDFTRELEQCSSKENHFSPLEKKEVVTQLHNEMIEGNFVMIFKFALKRQFLTSPIVPMTWLLWHNMENWECLRLGSTFGSITKAQNFQH